MPSLFFQVPFMLMFGYGKEKGVLVPPICFFSFSNKQQNQLCFTRTNSISLFSYFQIHFYVQWHSSDLVLRVCLNGCSQYTCNAIMIHSRNDWQSVQNDDIITIVYRPLWSSCQHLYTLPIKWHSCSFSVFITLLL